MPITRRRLITISAALAFLPAMARAAPQTSKRWTGQALGARASIRIDHPDGEAIAARVMAEIDRLENILSLYRADSALARLNRQGHLEEPPFELLECLSLASAVTHASNGRFDPTVQPLWVLWAEAAARGGRPDQQAITAAKTLVGWHRVELDAAKITLRPGMALTLNGIGQGYVADRVAAFLEAEGLTDILIDTGEFRALGGSPEGGEWPVRLESGERIGLRQRALATSLPLGTTFDAGGRHGHILDPRSGLPTRASGGPVSISAPSAAIADALSTTACLLESHRQVAALVQSFPGARLESLS
ncbi:FAD:protein FMN transferase [Peteryoungia ipomoeae]|uniref:FAD:protein FMN transferase n=1 Tax=Peteryoungia ipomoeae TaxID=1210932 RepID=A0A4V4HM32_9HYPH|nr:FAD:protein FMN transferase [Peteryoungia ipomoeae]THV20556.1 FAD:protein FMN transferase [Peteryoungia ipomoeae]